MFSTGGEACKYQLD